MGTALVASQEAKHFVVGSQKVETIRCPSCGLCQFSKAERRKCIRCRQALPTRQPEPDLADEIVVKPDFGKRVCRRIRVIRTQKRLSQRQLADKIPAVRSYVSKVENGFCVPTLPQLEKISRALSVSLADVLDDSTRKQTKRCRDSDPLSQEDMIAAIAQLLPMLDERQRAIILAAAKDLARGHYPFPDWINVK